MKRFAHISECGKYRYRLSRIWGKGGDKGFLHWIMLNPSTADSLADDPTIRKVIGFSKLFGFDGCVVHNLFAFRATDPKQLLKCDDPVGPEWLSALEDSFQTDRSVVAAWGAFKMEHADEQAGRVIEFLEDRGIELYCLGRTKDGSPKHPLYVPYSAKLTIF